LAATINTRELNGVAPGVASTIASPTGKLIFQMSDSHAEDASNPILRPVSGSYYSYWKSIYLNAVTTPPTEINNIKFYSSGTMSWTGVTLYVGDETPDVANYVQAVGTLGKTGTEIVTGYSGITAKTTMNTYTSGSPKSVTGSIATPNIGAISKLIVLQLTITGAVDPGDAGSATLTWRYDES